MLDRTAMELRHLRYFVAVAEEENVTRAAARLHISQPGVSRQIRDLEEELGVALLEHGAKAVRLTEAGRTFLAETRAVLQRLEKAVATTRAVVAGTAGELHVGYAPSLTVEILPAALRRFQGEFPGVRVLLHDLSSGEMIAQLHEGKLQVALGVRPKAARETGLHVEEVARYDTCVALAKSHPLARKRGGVSTAQLLQEALLVFSEAEYPEYHEGLKAIFGAETAKLQIAEEHESVTSLIAAVESGRGVAIVGSALACLSGPRLKLLPLVPKPAPIVVVAMRRAEATNAAARNFIAAAAAPRTTGRLQRA